MKPINLGNRIETLQWENGNELSPYPFAGYTELDGNGNPVEKSVLEPELWGVVSDLSIFIVSGYNQNVGSVPPFKLSSIHVGPGLVSMSVSNGKNTLVCSVPKSDFEPYCPYPMTSVGSENPCSGMCTFGDVFSRPPVFRRWKDGPIVMDSLVYPYRSNFISSFVDSVTGEEATGHVVFKLPTGVSAERVDRGPSYGDHIRLLTDGRYDDLIVSPCDDSDAYAGFLPRITNINGVTPNERGEIAIILE